MRDLRRRTRAKCSAAPGLHPRVGPGGLEIGYWIRASATRQGIVTESTAALTRVGFEVCEADRIEIRIEPRQRGELGRPAQARLRRGGDAAAAACRRGEGAPLRDVTIFTMFREDFDPSIAPGIRAFDARGERLL